MRTKHLKELSKQQLKAVNDLLIDLDELDNKPSREITRK
jgi:hypothetical protein